MTDEPVHLVDCDPAWRGGSRRSARCWRRSSRQWLAGPIEHIGSTAVPGLVAKPVIEMHWFCKPSRMARTHHLHLVPFGSALWAERLAFRDHLRVRADVARDYSRLKQDLAQRCRFDRDAYTDAKEPFVARVVSSAMGR